MTILWGFEGVSGGGVVFSFFAPVPAQNDPHSTAFLSEAKACACATRFGELSSNRSSDKSKQKPAHCELDEDVKSLWVFLRIGDIDSG